MKQESVSEMSELASQTSDCPDSLGMGKVGA